MKKLFIKALIFILCLSSFTLLSNKEDIKAENESAIVSIEYIYNNGHAPEPPIQVTLDNVKGVELATPTKAGYIFCGWYKDENFISGNGVGTKLFLSDLPDQSTNITLYAKWDTGISFSGELIVDNNSYFPFVQYGNSFASFVCDRMEFPYTISYSGAQILNATFPKNSTITFNSLYPFVNYSRSINTSIQDMKSTFYFTQIDFSVNNQYQVQYLRIGDVIQPGASIYPYVSGDSYIPRYLHIGSETVIELIDEPYINDGQYFLRSLNYGTDTNLYFEEIKGDEYVFAGDLDNNTVLNKGTYVYVDSKYKYNTYDSKHTSVFSFTDDKSFYHYLYMDKAYVVENVSKETGQHGEYTLEFREHNHTINDEDVTYYMDFENNKCTAKANCTTQNENHFLSQTIEVEIYSHTPATNFDNEKGEILADFESDPFPPYKGEITVPNSALGFKALDGQVPIYYRDSSDNLIIKTNALFIDKDSKITYLSILKDGIKISEIDSSFYSFIENKDTGYLDISISSSPLKFLESGVYQILARLTKGDKSLDMKTDFYVDPNPDSVDLYISFKPGAYIMYIKDKYIGNTPNEYINVSYNADLMKYDVTISSNLELYSDNGPIIRTNNNKKLTILSDSTISLYRSDPKPIEKNDYFIYSDSLLNIKSLTEDGVCIIRFKDSIDAALVKSSTNYPNSSFIYSKEDLNINNTNIVCSNYFSCFKSDKSIFINDHSTVNHVLLNIPSGNVYTAYANNHIQISSQSSYIANYQVPSEEFKVSFNGLYAKVNDIKILGKSKFTFNGNQYNENDTFGLKAGGNILIDNSSVGPSLLKLENTTVGAIGYNFDLENSDMNIKCNFGAILAKENIKFNFDSYISENCIIETKLDIPQNYIIDYNDQLFMFSNVNAIKSYSNNPENYIFFISSGDFCIKGSIDGSNYYNLLTNRSHLVTDYRFIKFMPYSPDVPSEDDANLVINNGDDTLYFVDDDAYFNGQLVDDDPISGLHAYYDNGIYYINVSGEVSLYAYDENCIYTNNYYDLVITGTGTLNIHQSCNPDNLGFYNNFSGIYCDGTLNIGDEVNRLTYNYFDEYSYVHRMSENYRANVCFNAIHSANGIYIDNVKIKSRNYGFALLNDSVSKVVSVSDRTDFTHEIIDVNNNPIDDIYLSTIKSAYRINIEFSNVTSYVVDKIDNSPMIVYGIVGNQNIFIRANANVNLIGNISNRGSTCAILQLSDNPNDCIVVEASSLTINNFSAGIMTGNNLINIIDSYINILTSTSCMVNMAGISIKYTDLNKIENFILQRDPSLNRIPEFLYPIVVQYNTNDQPIIPLNPNYIQCEFPNNNYKLQFSKDDINYEDYQDANYSDYNYVKIKQVSPVFEDLSICHNHTRSTYYNGNLLSGPGIDDLGVSIDDDGTYILDVSGDVEINSYDESAIYQYTGNLKIIGDGHLTLNLDCSNEDISGWCYGIYSSGSLTIGEENNTNKLIIEINDKFIKDIEDYDPINCYTYGLLSENDLNINNTKLLGNISCGLVSSNCGDVYINNSELIHNIYSNYSFRRNDSGEIFYSLFANGDIDILNNSSIKSSFVNYLSDSSIDYYGFQCNNFNLEDSILDMTSFDGVIDDEYVVYYHSDASKMFGTFKAKNSDITLINFFSGINAENDSIIIENCNINFKCFNTCFFTTKNIKIKLDKDSYSFNIESINKGDISIEKFILPAITVAGYDGFVIPSKDLIDIILPDTLKLSNDLNEEFNLLNIFKYRHIYTEKKEKEPDNPVNPPHKDDDHGHSSDNNRYYNIPKTGIK